MSDIPRPHFGLLKRYPMDLRAVVQNDPAVRSEAMAELAAASQIHEDRCVVTKEYAAALRRALG